MIFLELTTPSVLEYEETLDEYVIVDPVDFLNIDMSKGQDIGIIRAKNSQYRVYKLVDHDQFIFAAVDPIIGPSKPVGFIGYEHKGTNILMAKNLLQVRKNFTNDSL